MGIAAWVRGMVGSPLERACATLPDLASDVLPSPKHQALVQQIATECLFCLADLGKNSKKWEQNQARFEKHPLLGLEVFDEALVLYKNGSGAWGQIGGTELMILTMTYSGYFKKVEALRGGRPRRTTTPTLKGGGRRTS